jgi:Ca2+:H+ antiporter
MGKKLKDKAKKGPVSERYAFFKEDFSRLNVMLVFIPISIVLHFISGDPLLVFSTAALGIIPLAGLMGRATEEIALHTGQVTGGLLNATFGNATELIIALVALREAAANPAMRETLFQIVKASITGSIIGNILLVFGLSVLLGGLKHKVLKFSVKQAQMASSVMTMAVIGLLIPAMWALFPSFPQDPNIIEDVSIAVALVMITLYILSLVFSLVTHKELLNPDLASVKEVHENGEKKEKARWSKGLALGVLILTTVMVAMMSELLVGSVEGATKTMGLNELFVGVVIIAIIGNAAEHSTAVTMALKNKMEISLTIATGSSAQIAMLVTPLLVFASALMGTPMSLVFFPFELVAIAVAVVVMNMVSLDGESNWFEGCELLGVYIILAVMFFFIPIGN